MFARRTTVIYLVRQIKLTVNNDPLISLKTNDSLIISVVPVCQRLWAGKPWEFFKMDLENDGIDMHEYVTGVNLQLKGKGFSLSMFIKSVVIFLTCAFVNPHNTPVNQ